MKKLIINHKKYFIFAFICALLFWVTGCETNRVPKTLEAPTIVLEENVISWNEINDATSYAIFINGSLQMETEATTYKITETNVGTYNIAVKALGDQQTYFDSTYSNVVQYIVSSSTMTIEEVKHVADLAGKTGTEVTFIGTVIGFDSMGYAHVSDGTGSIYVRAMNPNLILHQKVKITGKTIIYTGTTYPEYTRQIQADGIVVESYDGNISSPKEVQILTQEEVRTTENTDYQNTSFHGNVVQITGIVECGNTKYTFYLNDDEGNHLLAIHHYSTNFQNQITDANTNVFLNLDGKRVTLTGIMYRFYTQENIWTLQCIGLDNEVVLIEDKLEQLTTPTPYLQDNVIYWNEIEHAVGYEIFINQNDYAYTTDTSFPLNLSTKGEYQIQVKAKADQIAYLDSALSKSIIMKVEEGDSQVNFFMVNDNHGAFVDDPYRPGIERVSSVLNELMLQNGDYVKIANGDLFQGSYVSSILYGRPMLDALNLMNFNAFVLGNHEFDWGLDEIQKYKDGNLENGEANFPFLGANVVYRGTTTRVNWLEPYTTVEMNGVKIGIIGIMGYGLESSILAENVADYQFLYPVDLVSELAIELRTKKECDVVVVASHDYDPKMNNEIGTLKNDARVDAIFCGHTHQKVESSLTRPDGVRIPILQNSGNSETVASLTMHLNENLNLDSYQARHYYPSDYKLDSTMTSLMLSYGDIIDEGNRVLGVTDQYLSRSTLGLLAVDAMKERYQTDFAIMNTGGVRTTISSGEVTVSDVFDVFPFNNQIILTVLTGEKLRSLYSSNGDFLYFSTNFEPSLLNVSTEYTIAVIDYVYTGAYYKEFIGTPCNNTGVMMRDVVIAYMDKNLEKTSSYLEVLFSFKKLKSNLNNYIQIDL